MTLHRNDVLLYVGIFVLLLALYLFSYGPVVRYYETHGPVAIMGPATPAQRAAIMASHPMPNWTFLSICHWVYGPVQSLSRMCPPFRGAMRQYASLWLPPGTRVSDSHLPAPTPIPVKKEKKKTPPEAGAPGIPGLVE